jgi:hypothetical protein
MRIFLHAIKELPRAEERPKGASRSTHRLAAAFFDRSGEFLTTSFAGMTRSAGHLLPYGWVFRRKPQREKPLPWAGADDCPVRT